MKTVTARKLTAIDYHEGHVVAHATAFTLCLVRGPGRYDRSELTGGRGGLDAAFSELRRAESTGARGLLYAHGPGDPDGPVGTRDCCVCVTDTNLRAARERWMKEEVA